MSATLSSLWFPPWCTHISNHIKLYTLKIFNWLYMNWICMKLVKIKMKKIFRYKAIDTLIYFYSHNSLNYSQGTHCTDWYLLLLFSHSVMSDSFVTPWTPLEPRGSRQAPLSMGFRRQECWNGLPFPSPGDLPDQRIEPVSPALQVDSLPLSQLSFPQFVFAENFSILCLCSRL